MQKIAVAHYMTRNSSGEEKDEGEQFFFLPAGKCGVKSLSRN